MDKNETYRLLGHRIFSFFREAEQLRDGIMPRPRLAIYHPTYLCNHNCPGCDFRYQNKELQTIISPEKGAVLLDKMLRFRIGAVEFSGGGEPLLYSGIAADVRKLKEHGVAVGLITNGSLLQGDTLEAFVDHASYIRVALDAGSAEVFNRVKGLDSKVEFERVLGNIRAALKMREERGKTLDVSVKFLVGKQNFMDMEKAVLLAAELGVDAIQFKLYENVDGIQFKDEDANTLEKDVGDLQRKLASIKEKYAGRLGRTTILGDLDRTSLTAPCWLNPIITLIDGLGDVYLCPYYRHRIDSHLLGNIFIDEFEDFWYSKKHWDRIEQISMEDCNLYDCRFHRYNQVMSELMDGDVKYLKFI